MVDGYKISSNVPSWSRRCFTEYEYSGVLCDECDGFVYAECERYVCFDEEIHRFQYRAILKNATVLVVNGDSIGDPRCKLPIIFTHHALHRSYGHNAYFELDTNTFVLWKLLYHIHSIAMMLISFSIMTLVVMRCRNSFVATRRYANVIVSNPVEVVSVAPPCTYVEMRNESDDVCAICLSNMDIGDTVAKLPCGHVYKKECISTWLSNESRCPLCNAQTT